MSGGPLADLGRPQLWALCSSSRRRLRRILTVSTEVPQRKWKTSGFLSFKSAKILLAKVTHMVRCTVSVGGGAQLQSKGPTLGRSRIRAISATHPHHSPVAGFPTVSYPHFIVLAGSHLSVALLSVEENPPVLKNREKGPSFHYEKGGIFN